MRLGIFSDVHANIEALSAVVEAYSQEDIDALACVGDVVGCGASPYECAEGFRR
jgi:predicted phosphodiesterase